VCQSSKEGDRIIGLRVVVLVLYLLVALVALSMARTGLTAQRMLPFHELAAGISWDDVGSGLRAVLLSLTRTVGLGFLVVALLLIVFPIVQFVHPGSATAYGPPALALLYCGGLAVVNHRLEAATSSPAPWKGSLCAAGLITLGMGLTAVAY
jgi:hypothetical protein